jgi:hypothetical protein
MATRARDLLATPGHLRRRQRLLAKAASRAEPGQPATRITHEQIALRAYEIYKYRGSSDRDPQSDWLEAEQELLHAFPLDPASGETTAAATSTQGGGVS